MKFVQTCLLAVVFFQPLAAKAVSTMEERIDRTVSILEQYGKAQGDSIPREVFQQAKGLVVMWIIKAGFIVAGEGGDGLVVMREGKKWTYPSAISAAGPPLSAFREFRTTNRSPRKCHRSFTSPPTPPTLPRLAQPHRA